MLILLAHLLVGLAFATNTPNETSPTPVFKLYVERDAIYRVTFEELAEAGLPRRPLESRKIGLRRQGNPVPLFVSDGGDGRFDPGDHLEFVGELRHGETSFLDEYSRYNCYVLDFTDSRPLRFTQLPIGGKLSAGHKAPLRTRFHLERDLLRLRFAEDGAAEQQEIWYWSKLTHLDQQTFGQVLDLHDLDLRQDRPVQITIGVRAWSNHRFNGSGGVAEHALQISLNGAVLANHEWNGNDPHVLTLEAPPSKRLQADGRLELRVPKRQLPGGSEDLVIDVVMLNWIEISYPVEPDLGLEQARIELTEPASTLPVRLRAPRKQPLVICTNTGARAFVSRPPGRRVDFVAGPHTTPLFVATPSTLRTVDNIAIDHPSRLRDPTRRADFIIIAHRTLVDAIAPLADMHRRRGLEVAVVDVEDVFDEFNFGVVHPRAIRDFLDHAYHNWQPPALRFVLLVGDASWDYKNPTVVDAHYADWTYRSWETTEFSKNTSTPYADIAELNVRNLVPTWGYPTFEGLAASDTWFACVDGDDELPDLAIGRIPTLTPEELAAVVAKTVRFVEDPEIGPWRRELLFITNEQTGFQRSSDRLALPMLEEGYLANTIYPQPSEPANEEHTRRIVEMLDHGVSVVHFLGHGGRYIWRTGPPDLKKNHDLFGLDELDQLTPNNRLPVILSMTCYSAPFDHPSADSIGEKFLRLPDRGAIAVVAASWRNSPSPRMGELLLEELDRPGATVGEAVLAAKRRLQDSLLNQTYNLLGDPAVPVATPRHTLVLTARREAGRVLVSGRDDTLPLPAQVIVELIDSRQQAVIRRELQIALSSFELALDEPTLEDGVELLGARAYLWNRDAKYDAIGWATVESSPDPEASHQEASTRTSDAPTPSEARSTTDDGGS